VRLRRGECGGAGRAVLQSLEADFLADLPCVSLLLGAGSWEARDAVDGRGAAGFNSSVWDSVAAIWGSGVAEAVQVVLGRLLLLAGLLSFFRDLGELLGLGEVHWRIRVPVVGLAEILLGVLSALVWVEELFTATIPLRARRQSAGSLWRRRT